MKVARARVLKIFGIVLCIVSGYIIFHNIRAEPYFNRYTGIFAGFIDIYLNDHISLDYFRPITLFYSNPQRDTSLSTMAQAIMYTESNIPNFVILFLTLHFVTGLSTQELIVLPLGLLFIPIAYFTMIKIYIPIKDKSDILFHVLLGIYFILYLGIIKMGGSFNIAAPSYLLIIITFLCMKKLHDKVSNRINYIIIGILTYSIAHYWHTALMIEMCFIFSLWIVSGFFSLLTSKRNLLIKSTLVFMITIIISLSSTHLWHMWYTGNFLRAANLRDFISKLFIMLIGGDPFKVPYTFNYKVLFWGKVYFVSHLSIYVLSTLILVLSLIPHIFASNNIKEKSGDKLPLIFGLSLICAQILNNFLYYKVGINFAYVPIFFPIFGVYSLLSYNKINKFRKFIIFSLSLMIILSLLCNIAFYASDELGATSFTKYKDTKSSFDWLYHNMNGSKTIVIDFNILGKYLQRETEKSKPSIEFIHLYPYSYGSLVGDYEIFKTLSRNYAVVDHATMSKGLPIHSYSGRALLEPKWIQIDNCLNQDKIYEDNYVSIFIFK